MNGGEGGGQTTRASVAEGEGTIILGPGAMEHAAGLMAPVATASSVSQLGSQGGDQGVLSVNPTSVRISPVLPYNVLGWPRSWENYGR